MSTTKTDRIRRNFATISTKGRPNSFVGARAPFTTKITITGPADFTINSVGTKTAETVKDGRRTVVWESDFPVSFFNVIAGRWKVEQGKGSAIYYHAGHPYNIAEMSEALEGARRYYSEWFYPYPWRELKLSEFPNLASYAQGFPTNITFSGGNRIPDLEHGGKPRRVRDHVARGGPPVVGQSALAGKGARRQHSFGGNVALFDDSAGRAGEGNSVADRFLQAPRGHLWQGAGRPTQSCRW